MTNRSHVFISHHFKDDSSVDGLVKLLSSAGKDVRNSSIRLKAANQTRLEKGEVSDRALKRALRMKISWASAVVVLIGRNTHERPWVAYEIEEAHRQGKPIVGVYERGGTDAVLPQQFEKYGCALVAWNAQSIVDAIDGAVRVFQNPDGSERGAVNSPRRSEC